MITGETCHWRPRRLVATRPGYSRGREKDLARTTRLPSIKRSQQQIIFKQLVKVFSNIDKSVPLNNVPLGAYTKDNKFIDVNCPFKCTG